MSQNALEMYSGIFSAASDRKLQMYLVGKQNEHLMSLRYFHLILKLFGVHKLYFSGNINNSGVLQWKNPVNRWLRQALVLTNRYSTDCSECLRLFHNMPCFPDIHFSQPNSYSAGAWHFSVYLKKVMLKILLTVLLVRRESILLNKSLNFIFLHEIKFETTLSVCLNL